MTKPTKKKQAVYWAHIVNEGTKYWAAKLYASKEEADCMSKFFKSAGVIEITMGEDGLILKAREVKG